MFRTTILILFVAAAAGSSFLLVKADNQVSNELILKDVRERGPYWRQSPYLSFCNSTLYRQTEETCADHGLQFDASKCKCLNDPRERPVRNYYKARVRSFRVQEAKCMYDIDSNKLNIEAFIDEAARTEYRLVEYLCSPQLGPVVLPQPSAAHLRRQPEVILGVSCVGLPDLHGRKCVPKETFIQKVEVEHFDLRHGHTLDPEIIEIRLPRSCYMSAINTPNACDQEHKFADAAGTCHCKSLHECHSDESWNDERCSCEPAMPSLRPRSPRDAINTDTTTVQTTTTTTEATTATEPQPTKTITEAPSTAMFGGFPDGTLSPIIYRPSTVSLELACLRSGGCALGFGRIFNRMTLECSCSCHVQNMFPKFICKMLMKNPTYRYARRIHTPRK